MSDKTLTNGGQSDVPVTNYYDNLSNFSNTVPIRINNDYYEDMIQEKIRGKRLGFTGGYTSDLTTSNSFVLPGSPTSVNLPPVTGTGLTTISIASTSAADTSVVAGTSTGVKTFILFLMSTDFTLYPIFVDLNGTTPVALPATNVYHFAVGFAVAAGSAYSSQGFGSNVGTIYVGSGSFSTSTGFTTNYMWNRPGDGFVSSTVYVVPKNVSSQLLSVKFNSDSAVSTVFSTIGRTSRTAPWSIGSQDTVNTTLVIERSLSGGFQGPGGEYTVIARKAGTGNNIGANFVMTLLEVDTRQFNANNAL